jgi:hypothetical protein
MFNLTSKERWLVAFVIAALLVGSAVRYYRAIHQKPEPLVETNVETKGR